MDGGYQPRRQPFSSQMEKETYRKFLVYALLNKMNNKQACTLLMNTALKEFTMPSFHHKGYWSQKLVKESLIKAGYIAPKRHRRKKGELPVKQERQSNPNHEAIRKLYLSDPSIKQREIGRIIGVSRGMVRTVIEKMRVITIDFGGMDNEERAKQT